MKHLIVWLFILGAQSYASEFNTIKIFQFSLEHGSLQVEVRADSSGESSLGLSPVGKTHEAPISEQIAPLSKVLDEMPKLGLDPHRIRYVGTRIFSRDVLTAIAYKCADSSDWKKSVKNKGKEKILIGLLNESNIYAPYDQVFSKYSLRLKVSEIENVFLMKFSSIPARNALDRSNANLLVPADAIIGIRLSPAP